MATGGFKYEPAALEQASSDLASGSASVMQELEMLSRKVAPLQEAFVGQAGQGFQQLWTDWHISAKKLQSSLDGLSRLLHGAAVNAAQMEQANTRLMQQG